MGRLLLLPMFFFCLSIQAQDTLDSCPIISSSTQDFCDYVFDEAAKKVVPATISALKASGDIGKTVVWYSENGQPLPEDYKLVDGAVYYAGYEDGSCTTKPSVTVRVDRQPVAGRTCEVWVCSNSVPVEIYDLMPVLNDGTSRPAEAGGTVNPSLKSGSTLFDPSKEISGTSYKYTTPNSQYGICGPDDATITIHIVEAPNAGADARKELVANEGPFNLTTVLDEDATKGGEWSPELPDGFFDPATDTPGIFTYTVTTTGGGITCEDSAEVEVLVLPVSITICHRGKLMTIDKDALPAHLKHGDTEGSCTAGTVVSPNPSHGIFHFQNKQAEILQIWILDINGNLQKEFSSTNGNGLKEIDISDLKKGIYFAEIITSQGKQIERIIKK